MKSVVDYLDTRTDQIYWKLFRLLFAESWLTHGGHCQRSMMDSRTFWLNLRRPCQHHSLEWSLGLDHKSKTSCYPKDKRTFRMNQDHKAHLSIENKWVNLHFLFLFMVSINWIRKRIIIIRTAGSALPTMANIRTMTHTTCSFMLLPLRPFLDWQKWNITAQLKFRYWSRHYLWTLFYCVDLLLRIWWWEFPYFIFSNINTMININLSNPQYQQNNFLFISV